MSETEAAKVETTNANGGVENEKGEKSEIKNEAPPEEPKLGPPNALERKIIKQIEYYFGDINLPRDKFLQDEMKLEDGWVSLATMTKFNRLKSLTTNHKIISTALRKSESGLLQVSKDNIFIRRNPEKPMPENTEERRNEFNLRSAYAKGFPQNLSLDTLIAYFEKFAPIDTVYMRRDLDRKFKGSVFVTFRTEEDCKAFLSKPEVKYEDTVLERKSKIDYFKEREEEKKQRKLDQLRRKKEEQQRREAEERQKLIDSITPGAVLHLTGITGEEVTREDFKSFFNDYATIAWVDFEKGDSQAWLRFNDANTARPALEKAMADHDGKLEITNCVLEGRILEGEEELDHWRKIFKERADVRNRSKENRKRKYGSKGRHSKDKRRKEDGGSDGEGGGDDDDDDDDDGEESGGSGDEGKDDKE